MLSLASLLNSDNSGSKSARRIAGRIAGWVAGQVVGWFAGQEVGGSRMGGMVISVVGLGSDSVSIVDSP